MKKLTKCYVALLLCYTMPLASAMLDWKPEQENYILPEGYHLVAAKQIDGKLIELGDGSQFIIFPADAETVLQWETNTPVTISPNAYPYAGSDFFITNQRNGVSVYANFSNGPVIGHRLTNQIEHIDLHYGEIYLRDGRGNLTCWQIEPQDLQYIAKWELQETVVIGVNDSWFSRFFSNCEFILTSYENFKTVKYVRANRKQL